MLRNFLFVGIGGAFGAMMRYGITLLSSLLSSSSIFGTFVTNIIGSFFMGLIISSCQSEKWTLFLAVGICGGFTTFSTFSMQSLSLIQDGKHFTALGYMAVTMMLCLACSYLGYLLGCKTK